MGAFMHGSRIETGSFSILCTLAADEYDVEPDAYIINSSGRIFSQFGLRFVYEDLPELELLGLEESEEALGCLMIVAVEGRPQPPCEIKLDVGWRNTVSPTP